jgi:chromate transporter
MSNSAVPSPDPNASSPDRPTLAAIFRAFIGVSLSGFGGALPWARRMIVDRRGWMTAEEFNEAFSLSQFLPGPNTVNFAVVFGSRFGGAAGAALALVGLLGPPVIIVTTLAFLYSRYGDLETLNRILAGIAAAAAGMLIAIAAKMVTPLLRKGLHWARAVALVAFICVALLQYPLPLVFLALAPFSIAFAWFRG